MKANISRSRGEDISDMVSLFRDSLFGRQRHQILQLRTGSYASLQILIQEAPILVMLAAALILCMFCGIFFQLRSMFQALAAVFEPLDFVMRAIEFVTSFIFCIALIARMCRFYGIVVFSELQGAVFSFQHVTEHEFTIVRSGLWNEIVQFVIVALYSVVPVSSQTRSVAQALLKPSFFADLAHGWFFAALALVLTLFSNRRKLTRMLTVISMLRAIGRVLIFQTTFEDTSDII